MLATGLVVELHHVAVERVLLLGILSVQGANKGQSGKGHHNGGNGELSVISHHRTPSQTSQPCRTPTGGARAPTTSNTHISCGIVVMKCWIHAPAVARNTATQMVMPRIAFMSAVPCVVWPLRRGVVVWC